MAPYAEQARSNEADRNGSAAASGLHERYGQTRGRAEPRRLGEHPRGQVQRDRLRALAPAASATHCAAPAPTSSTRRPASGAEQPGRLLGQALRAPDEPR